MEILIVSLISLWIATTIVSTGRIIINIDETDNCYIHALKELLYKLFVEKNLFRIILGFIISVVLLPSLFLVFVIQIVYWILTLFEYLWNLCSKR